MITKFNNMMERIFLSKYSDSSYTLKRRASALFYLVLIFFFIILIFFISHIIEGVFDRGSYIFFPFSLIVSIFILIILKRGHFTVSTNLSIIFVSIIVILATVIVVTGFVDHSGSVKVQRYILMLFTFPAIIVGAALFCHKNWIYATALLFLSFSTVFYFVINPAFEENGMAVMKPVFLFSTVSMLLIVVITILNRSITDSALEKTEKYASELSVLVDERTAELNIALEKMKIINEELNQKNIISEKNLKLATRVQAGIYPQKPPSVPGWDVSFFSKAASGVTGDLYDFFIENNKFSGVALFDISGHGISAGLISILAKSIISRNFISNYKSNLKDIIEKINGELFTVIGSVDNYLSGVLLRIKDDYIEYVNLGHIDILLKRNDNKNVIFVSPKDVEYKGTFLGISSKAEGLRTINFKISPGDSLLLLTDGVIEGRNDLNEEYGLDRLINAFKNSPDDNADLTLKYIINDFNAFVENELVKDDISIIVIKNGDS